MRKSTQFASAEKEWQREKKSEWRSKKDTLAIISIKINKLHHVSRAISSRL
jgi:hypothetical protein